MSNENESGKPTPGPWLYRGKSSSVHESCTTHPFGKVIFKFHEGYEGEELPKEADLDLILAAPDMLEALIRARDDLNNAAFLIRKQLGEHHWLYGIEKGKKIADEAIARARGLSQ